MRMSVCNGVIIFKAPALALSVIARSLLVVVGALTLSGCASLLFYPMKKIVATPADHGVAYQDVYIAQGDIRLHGWWLPAASEARGTVYFLHGNAENISTHMHSVLWLPEKGYNVFLLDYRGYGQSGGEPELAGVIDDVRKGYQWLRDRQVTAPLIVLGQSLGGGVAGFAMATQADKPDAMVLDAAVASYPRIAGEVARRNWVTWPFAPLAPLLMPKGFDLIDVVGQLAGIPQLYIHSPDDSVVPIGHSHSLYAKAASPKQLRETAGPHIATFAFAAQRQALLDFIASL